MKRKTILSIVAIVMVVAMLSTCLVACNNKNKEPEKASNAETLGTAIAMAANTAAGSATAAAEDADNDGININVTGNASLAVNGAMTAITPVLESALQTTVNSVSCFVNENGVAVENLAKDAEGFVADSDYTLKVSVSYTNDKEEAVTDVYYVAVDTNDANIEGTDNFNFTIKVYVSGTEDAVFSVSGNATYKSDVEGLAFNFTADLGVANATVSAYATKTGTIAIDVNAGAGVFGTGVTAGVKVELGKLADNKYGANVTVAATASLTGVGTVSATVKANVVAEKTEDAHDFAIDGSVEVKLVPSYGDNDYIVSANVSGKATYVEADDEYVVSVSGTAAVTTEAKESK